MPRSDELYLRDMLEASRAIHRYVVGKAIDDPMSDELLSDAVLRRFIVLGEAAARIGSDANSRYARIEWNKARGFGNVAVRADFALDWTLIGSTRVDDVPVLIEALEPIVGST